MKKRLFGKRAAAALLTLALAALGLPSAPVITAADGDPVSVSINSPGASGDGWVFDDSTLTINAAGNYEISGSGETSNTIEVADGVTGVVNITLKDVNIKSWAASPLDINGATVNLWLEGANTLTAIEAEESTGAGETAGTGEEPATIEVATAEAEIEATTEAAIEVEI
jgi:hypothetical protein